MRFGSLRHWTLGLMGGSTLLAAACSLVSTPPSPNHQAILQRAAPAQLAQLDFGRQATFARCIPPACPIRTPKTLALETPDPSIKRTDAPIPTEPAPPAVPLAPALKKEVSRTLTLRFGLGSAKLSPAARTELKGTLPDLKSARRITIIGRTDNTGPLAFNDSLALARAMAVRDHLLKTHPRLTPALTIKAQGGCCFVAPNDTQAGRTQNRRVEVVFQMNDGLPP
ncbi:OmpA family protein [Ferribacterium limneticum]|uniref:OmpA family protein n=1 Tax=Ferribacterium limneticum TaxID=76259 RepID=UPI001CF99F65|nr:OmpA family protein [Ferribacterium limneticum]UCV17897.1 OmpA family protein [Ferribacterium limneticum]